VRGESLLADGAARRAGELMRTGATGLLASPGVAPLLRHHPYSSNPHRVRGPAFVRLLPVPSQRRASSAGIPPGSGLIMNESLRSGEGWRICQVAIS
jgi:hypothetical protein